MKIDKFKEIVQEMFDQCFELLNLKERDYSDGVDRLIQFKTAAILKGESPIDSLSGMMVKHTTKLYMMLDNDFGARDKDQWEEVLNDHVNYLFLLKALLIDEGAI